MYDLKRINKEATTTIALALGVATIGFSATGASASVEMPFVTMDWMPGNGSAQQFVMHEDSAAQWFDPSSDAWVFEGSSGSSAWGMEWSITANDEADIATGSGSQFVNANLAVTNNTGSFQSFFAIVTLALPEQFTGGTLMNGSVSASVQDVFGSGAEIRTVNDNPIYQAFIDGTPPDAPVQTLLDPSYSLTAPVGGTESDSDTFGIPNPIAGPEALNTISVVLEFELSPFDTANVVGTFEVASLPAPGALPLLAGLGLFGVSRRRRG